MVILFAIINLVLIVAMLAAFIWVVIGVPLGLIFLYRYFKSKDKDKDKYIKKIIICSLGLIFIVVIPILWAIVNLLSALVGGSVLQSGFGELKTLPVQ